MEKKKVFRVLATYSQEATLKLDVYDPSLEVTLEDYFETDEKVNKYTDWDIIEFETKAEAKAYIKGIEDANGWIDPYAVLL